MKIEITKVRALNSETHIYTNIDVLLNDRNVFSKKNLFNYEFFFVYNSSSIMKMYFDGKYKLFVYEKAITKSSNRCTKNVRMISNIEIHPFEIYSSTTISKFKEYVKCFLDLFYND